GTTSRNTARVPVDGGTCPGFRGATRERPSCAAGAAGGLSIARCGPRRTQMSMRMSISQAAMAVLAGCGVTATTEYTATDQARASGPTGKTTPFPKCPDLPDCTHSNGSGVFFEEAGNAGINAPSANVVMMMITAFTNSPSGVTFRGRYDDSSS